MATAKVDLVIDYGESWKLIANFPSTLTTALATAIVDVEILQAKNIRPEESLLKLSTSAGNVTLTGSTVSLAVSSQDLQNKLKAGKYHWRFYVHWADGVREEVMGGTFSYLETF